MLAPCHLLLQGQTLTNAAPPAAQAAPGNEPSLSLPDDPSQEILPIAQPEPAPASGVPVEWEAQNQSRLGDVLTLTGGVVGHYRDYILRADKVVYHQETTKLEADGNLQVAGGPNDVLLYADRGEMQLNTHTARYFNARGSQGIRALGRSQVFTSANPFYFTGKVVLEIGEGRYKIIDGTMTNCRLPKPDWQIISRSIQLEDGKASTTNAFFKFAGVPLVYLPYLRHPVDDAGRDSGFLIPVFSTGSSIRGYTFGEQFYWAISRNMDMIAGAEYFSKRGWAPNGDFRYKGAGFNNLTIRVNALLDRGFVPPAGTPLPVANCNPSPASNGAVNQGGLDIKALGSKDLSGETRLAGDIEYLSCYVYRVVFSNNYTLATNSEVPSTISLTHTHKGFVPSLSLARFESFASATEGDEVKFLRLPTLRFDVLDRPLGASTLYWGLGSSLGYLNRSEPGFHARNAGRIDFYPHLALPLSAGGWSLLSEAAVRETAYTISQNPDLAGTNCIPNPTDPSTKICGIPTISHDPLNRSDVELSLDLRPPAVERDFTLNHWNRELRHVIEPEIAYRYVTGIGAQAQSVLLNDSTDIATNTNEVGYSLTQRLYLRETEEKPCAPEEKLPSGECPAKPREWASWQIAQKFFIDPSFGGAVISGRRNVFDSTLDLSGVTFLNAPRNLSPVTSRLRFEAIDNLRIQWDLDYDPKAGRMDADNLLAGYSWGRTTIGLGHAMLSAINEINGATLLKSRQVQPFFSFGKSGGNGFNLAANAGYDFVSNDLQYAAVQSVYNWNCCGLTFGYRRFNLGSIRNETQYLYGFTLANFGSVGDVRRSNSAFRDPALPPAY
jgi:LPS-assembly protein